MSGPKRLLRGETVDGVEVLVTIWEDDSAEIATRTQTAHTWSPPLTLQDWPTS